jgi:N-acetylglutamate synthase-like GNAT family acetyltransferase
MPSPVDGISAPRRSRYVRRQVSCWHTISNEEEPVGTAFVPGEWWTPERAASAVQRMADVLASPEMQAMMQAISEAGEDDPAAVAAAMAGGQQHRSIAPPDLDPAACSYRRGRAGDEPRFAELIIHGELPPLFITEFVEGFVAAEYDGAVIGCGGLEIYDDCGVIRSVVVDANARNKRIGERMAELLIEDARAAGATDLYLFTMHAAPFWRRLAFEDTPITAWKSAPRVSWQYQFIEQHPEVSRDVIPMWRKA